ncbi:hypothetical protein REPUB_Repub11eG0140700 [Reevesia pubescens]
MQYSKEEEDDNGKEAEQAKNTDKGYQVCIKKLAIVPVNEDKHENVCMRNSRIMVDSRQVINSDINNVDSMAANKENTNIGRQDTGNHVGSEVNAESVNDFERERGDFNIVRNASERRCWVYEGVGIQDFNNFINDGELVDWRPQPFKFLNYWLENKDFTKVAADKWHSFNVQGNPGFKVKVKLGRLKCFLKSWNKEVFGHAEKNIELLEIKLLELVDIRDNRDLSIEELDRKKLVTHDLWVAHKHK